VQDALSVSCPLWDMAILLFSRTIVKRVSQSLTEIITIPRNRAGRS